MAETDPSIRPLCGLLRANGLPPKRCHPVRAECLAQQGISKHEWGVNCRNWSLTSQMISKHDKNFASWTTNRPSLPTPVRAKMQRREENQTRFCFSSRLCVFAREVPFGSGLSGLGCKGCCAQDEDTLKTTLCSSRISLQQPFWRLASPPLLLSLPWWLRPLFFSASPLAWL